MRNKIQNNWKIYKNNIDKIKIIKYKLFIDVQMLNMKNIKGLTSAISFNASLVLSSNVSI